MTSTLILFLTLRHLPSVAPFLLSLTHTHVHCIHTVTSLSHRVCTAIQLGQLVILEHLADTIRATKCSTNATQSRNDIWSVPYYTV